MINIDVMDAFKELNEASNSNEFTEGVYIDLNYKLDYDGNEEDVNEYPLDSPERYNIEYPQTEALVKIKLTTEGSTLNIESFSLVVSKVSAMVEDEVIKILASDKTISKVFGEDIEKINVSVPEESIGILSLKSHDDILYITLKATVSENY